MEGLPEGSEGLPKGLDGLPEEPEGLAEECEGLPEGAGRRVSVLKFLSVIQRLDIICPCIQLNHCLIENIW